MHHKTTFLATAFVVAAASFGLSATAEAATSWSNPNGVADSYSFTNGSSTNGSYNDPIVSGDSLLFAPTGYIAESDGNTSFSDTLSVMLQANNGLQFNTINFGMGGDFAVLVPGTASAGAMLTVTNLDTSAELSTPVTSEQFAMGDGLFTLDGSLNLPGGWSNVLVKLTGDLFATSTGGIGSSAIQFKSAGLSADAAAIIPIPAGAFAAPLVLVGGLIARKRMSGKR